MKTTLKSLEKNLLDLKQDLSKEYGNIIKRLGNLEKAVIDLQKDDAKFLKQQQSRFKVGDYVEFYDAEKIKHKGMIKLWYGNDELKVFDIGYFDRIPLCDIIGYAKPDLLTQEEKEYLSAVIKPFRNEIVCVFKSYDGSVCFRNDLEYSLVYVSRFVFRFSGLEECKHYTLEELGL